ncbi:RHS repeat protein [Streptomyces canus]|uniref:RHS repeat domain-containing protein n=1 Tax=Streptomyces canus TaxID=58343 RepID=UPI0022552BD3|nr:RHS repeat domain-containing protein [Streptomyces canus]MCX4859648.1 RHS repeat protein [Streptomyces canus]WSW35107.1 RHS repeat protein [Streptomyces canus]
MSSLYGKGRSGGTVGSSAEQTTKWSYDKRGLPTSVTDAETHTSTYAYDEAGNLAVTTAPSVQAEVDGTDPVTVQCGCVRDVGGHGCGRGCGRGEAG